MRRSREEIAAEYEAKAAALRKQESRAEAVKKSKKVRKLLSTARALKAIAEEANVLDRGQMLTVASDLERMADAMIGQYRVEDCKTLEEIGT